MMYLCYSTGEKQGRGGGLLEDSFSSRENYLLNCKNFKILLLEKLQEGN